MNTDEKINRLKAFKKNLIEHEEKPDTKIREWLNQNASWVRREVVENGCFRVITIAPPPAVGGAILHDLDPFEQMFNRPYLMSLVPMICDMIDSTIGVLLDPPAIPSPQNAPAVEARIQRGYAFIAMPIDKDDHLLVDVLEAIKSAAANCDIVAERVDEVESSERITDRILESITKAEFVIVDLTKEKPNVFFEAGFAHGLGKTPIYVARHGTTIHFDIKDYPIIMFHNIGSRSGPCWSRSGAASSERSSPWRAPASCGPASDVG